MSKMLNALKISTGGHTPAARRAMRAAWHACLESLPGLAVGGQAAERLFEALDGRVIAGRGRQWLIEIYSVRREANATWFQLALHGETGYSILMRLAPDEGVKQATAVLSSWLSTRHDPTHIVNVA
jgi:hypothetical protein